MEKNLETYVENLFLKYGKKLRFKIGQSLSSDKYIGFVLNYQGYIFGFHFLFFWVEFL